MFRRSVEGGKFGSGRRRGAGIESPRRQGGTLMKRVSAVFRSSSVDTSVSSSEEEESTDNEIRRPSGLGRMVVEEEDFAEDHDLDDIDEAEVELQYAWKAPLASPRRQYHSPRAPPTNLEKPVPPIPFPLSADTVKQILGYIPRTSLPTYARVSRTFYDAANTILYGTLVDPPSAALRVDRAELVRSLTLTTFTPYSYSHSSQMNYTLQLERVLPQMSSLTSLTLPYFDPDLLRQHSAFGLKRLVLMNEEMSADEEDELIGWLDGQINIVEVSWPRLRDVQPREEEEESQDFLAPSYSPISQTYTTAPNTPLTPAHPPGIPFDFPHSPIAPSFTGSNSPITKKACYSSPTLLPSLKYLHGPPPLVERLCQCPRPLTHLTLTLSQSIYDGFRPAGLMRALPSSLQSIEFMFAPTLDRRTREKILRVAGAVCAISRLGLGEFSDAPSLPSPPISPRRDADAESLFPLPRPKSVGSRKTSVNVKKEEEERTRALWHLAMACGICFPTVEEIKIVPGSESYADWLAASPVWENVQRIVYGEGAGDVWVRKPAVVEEAMEESGYDSEDDDYGTEIHIPRGQEDVEKPVGADIQLEVHGHHMSLDLM